MSSRAPTSLQFETFMQTPCSWPDGGSLQHETVEAYDEQGGEQSSAGIHGCAGAGGGGGGGAGGHGPPGWKSEAGWSATLKLVYELFCASTSPAAGALALEQLPQYSSWYGSVSSVPAGYEPRMKKSTHCEIDA